MPLDLRGERTTTTKKTEERELNMLTTRRHSLLAMGRLDEARLVLDRATEFAREQDDTVSFVAALDNYVVMARFWGGAI